MLAKIVTIAAVLAITVFLSAMLVSAAPEPAAKLTAFAVWFIAGFMVRDILANTAKREPTG